MLPPPGRSRKRRIPGPIGLLEARPGAHPEDLSEEPADRRAEDDASPWVGEVWRAAWAGLGLPAIFGPSPHHDPPSSAWAAALGEGRGTPVRELVDGGHWERERSGLLLVLVEQAC